MADLPESSVASAGPTPSPPPATDRGWRQRSGGWRWAIPRPSSCGWRQRKASTHGHRFLQDLLRGSTADRVRHGVSILVLMVRAK